ncbi:MAG: GDP-L-fucose synthase [Candidatus Argoarchaeum ethanivorans]|uniref:GDP-L-fucose synthase n=1 Tax=Candidatus Argoarchaeum ethanivorans TaxID=2608793 RepID=A0A811T6K7_9EURY|nr:MAG: GDP-L-fucose synthase [Candidatus Argoarchaeum ethanivorans]
MTKTYRILVTGATGFVGSNLVRRLSSNGHDIHILTRRSSNKWRLMDCFLDLHNHTIDLLNQKELKGLMTEIEPDVIFHLATSSMYGGVQRPDREVIETNLLGAVNLINACNDIDYKCFVNTGSSSEYGPKKEPMKETDICEPINFYGISKCAATLYGQSIAQTKDKPIIGLRLFSPFGPFDDKSRLITYAITNALQNKPLLLGDPAAVRDYIYIEDVLDVYLQSMEIASGLKGEVFNVGSGSQITVTYIVNRIIEITDSQSEIKWNSFSGRAYDTEKWEADIEKVNRSFNWRPKCHIDDGIRQTISWFENNLHLYK